MTTDPLQAAPLTDAAIKNIRDMLNIGMFEDGVVKKSIRGLLATIDHLKSSAGWTSPASVVSAPAPGEVEELARRIVSSVIDDILWCKPDDPCLDKTTRAEMEFQVKDILISRGYRKFLPSAEVVDISKDKLRSIIHGAILGDGVYVHYIRVNTSDFRTLQTAAGDESVIELVTNAVYAALHPTPTPPVNMVAEEARFDAAAKHAVPMDLAEFDRKAKAAPVEKGEGE